MNLQQFVTDAIETMGGIVEPLEYALCLVLLPDEYASRFQERTELTLAFDYEVAEEHGNAEFVTFGSRILDEFIDIAAGVPMSTARYVLVDRLDVIDAEEKIRNLMDGRFIVAIRSKRPIMGIWGFFLFVARCIADESFEETYKVWVNLTTGEVDETMSDAILFYETRPSAEYPYANEADFLSAYQIAYDCISDKSERDAVLRVDPKHAKQEMERVKYYYQELLEENERRMNRKGVSDERVEELGYKRAALEIERDRQLIEIRENLSPKPQLTLLQGISYHIPLLEITCLLTHRTYREEKTYYYEPIQKRFFSD
ncbi:MAG: hypothetical protein LBB94_05335 [Clostridiales bacterium]|nr:hypothetical protein [Clostridiales bacterium]